MAVHQGPYLSIEPLQEELGPADVQYLVDGVCKRERDEQGLPGLDLKTINSQWGNLENYLNQSSIRAIVRSASEDVPEPNIEAMASRAAKAVNIPVFVLEDFPGNYWHSASYRLDGLFVEGDSQAALHQSRGVDPALIYRTGNPRYQWLHSVDRQASRRATRESFGLSEEQPVVLWAGQPDGTNSFLALTRILENLHKLTFTLLFRAHPRDELYESGAYRQILAGRNSQLVDVTSNPDVVSLYCASDLVLTQFSSAGVEASHLGVPAVFVLFEDLGRAWLLKHKGYSTLPWSDDGCSYLIEHEDEVEPVISEALFDSESRRTIIGKFCQKYGPTFDSTREIVRRILQTVDRPLTV